MFPLTDFKLILKGIWTISGEADRNKSLALFVKSKTNLSKRLNCEIIGGICLVQKINSLEYLVEWNSIFTHWIKAGNKFVFSCKLIQFRFDFCIYK
jgi:hypothetical protein